MNFENLPPEWENEGETPTEYLQTTGFMAGYKPPAKVFNWFFALVGKCIKELQTAFNRHEGKTSDSTSASALSSSDTNYPTVRDIYYGLPKINNGHSYTSNTSIYAPTSAGSTGWELVGNNGTPIWKAPSYAVCSTSGSTYSKAVAISNFKLTTGVRVLVKFTYEHTGSAAATLNVSSTGAKSIVVHCGTTNVFVQNNFSWLAGETVEFVYDGSYWVAISSDMRFIAGAQSATVVIGTTKTQGYCDFRCDGENDAAMFQNAIDRLYTYMSRNPISEDAVMWTKGGTILIKEGSYHIDTKLTLNQAVSGSFITFEGEGKFGTVINTDGLETFMSSFESVSFRSLALLCNGVHSGNFFDSGYSLSFDDCHISIANTASNADAVGCFADLTTSAEIGQNGMRGDGTFRMTNSEMRIYTVGGMNCYSGIVCEIAEIENSKIILTNESTNSNTELNLIYSAEKGGYISNCIIACTGRTTVVNSSKLNMSSNVISLQSSTARISHYDTSVTTLGGTFTGNTVYCYYYVYMRFATITGNKFLKLDAYKANTNSCTLYNQCPAAIVGNCFDGGTNGSNAHGTWYINTSSPIVCKQNISVGTLSKTTNVPSSSLFADNLNVG